MRIRLSSGLIIGMIVAALGLVIAVLAIHAPTPSAVASTAFQATSTTPAGTSSTSASSSSSTAAASSTATAITFTTTSTVVVTSSSTSSVPLAATPRVVTTFTAQRHGATVLFRWQIARAIHSGIDGFRLYAGKHQLTTNMIPAHAAFRYQYRAHWTRASTFRLKVLFHDGTSYTATTH